MAPVANEQGVSGNLGIIGSGNLGKALLAGILAQIQRGTANSALPRHFNVSVRSEQSERQLRNTFSEYDDSLSTYRIEDNVRLAADSDAVLIAVPPDDVCSVLSVAGMGEALRNKLLISVAAGVTRSQIKDALYQSQTPETFGKRVQVVRALPNLAASLGESITAISLPSPEPSRQTVDLVTVIFEAVGKIVCMPESLFNASTFLCGSTPAFIALFCDAMIDGAVAAGVPRDRAQAIMVQNLKSTAALLHDGLSPSALRESVCAQPGCTIGGIMALENGGVRGVIASSVERGVVLASKLGQSEP